MNTAHRRRIRYIDHAIQKWMLVALVAIEVGLVALSVWTLDYRLRELLEAQLYRVHFSAQAAGPADLLAEAGMLVAAFSLINLLALMAAEAIWAGYVGAVVERFREAMARTARLDFTPLPPAPLEHDVLELAVAWRQRECERLEAVRDRIARLGASPRLPEAALRRELEELFSRLA